MSRFLIDYRLQAFPAEIPLCCLNFLLMDLWIFIINSFQKCSGTIKNVLNTKRSLNVFIVEYMESNPKGGSDISTNHLKN